MKILTGLLVAGMVSSVSHAARLEKVLQCEGAHIDVNAGERRQLQLVVTDPAALRFLHEQQLASLPFGATEHVIGGTTRYAMDFSAAYGHKLRHGSGRGVFYPHDFNHFIDDRSIGTASSPRHSYYSDKTLAGRLVTVYRKGAELKLQYADLRAHGCTQPTVFRTDCGGEGGGYCPRTVCDAEEHTSFTVTHEYTFRGCR